jgi:uncharacterized protein HemY
MKLNPLIVLIMIPFIIIYEVFWLPRRIYRYFKRMYLLWKMKKALLEMIDLLSQLNDKQKAEKKAEEAKNDKKSP